MPKSVFIFFQKFGHFIITQMIKNDMYCMTFKIMNQFLFLKYFMASDPLTFLDILWLLISRAHCGLRRILEINEFDKKKWWNLMKLCNSLPPLAFSLFIAWMSAKFWPLPERWSLAQIVAQETWNATAMTQTEVGKNQMKLVELSSNCRRLTQKKETGEIHLLLVS